MKRVFGIMILFLAFAVTGCSQTAPSSVNGPSSQTNLPAQDQANPAQNAAGQGAANTAGNITTFSVTPAEGWTFLDTASSDTFKSYNLLSPYVASANFWIRRVGSNVFDGDEKSVRAAVEKLGFSEYEFISVDKLENDMPTIRCIIKADVMGRIFMLGHYFIDAPGDLDIYFQLSAAPEDFVKAQPLWENALKTLKTK